MVDRMAGDTIVLHW